MQTDRAASPAQISFLTDLVAELRGPEAVEKAVTWAQGASYALVSNQISRLKAERSQARRERDAATFERASVRRWEPVGEGFYMMDEQVIKVVKSPYARNPFGLTVKTLNPDLGVWELAAPLLRLLKPEHKMTLEQAQAYGRLTGRCCRCAAILTDSDSIERGLGPICASKF